MSTFVDTSALLAVLDADDAHHTRADRSWAALLSGEEELQTTSYVLVETCALAQARLGLAAVGVLEADVVPVLRVLWVDEALHRAAPAGPARPRPFSTRSGATSVGSSTSSFAMVWPQAS